MLKQWLSRGVKKPGEIIDCMFIRMGAGVLFFLVSAIAFADDDELKDAATKIKATFGSSSTFMHIMYTIEAIMAMYLYHKTRNIAVFIGIAVLALFANFALTTWGVG